MAPKTTRSSLHDHTVPPFYSCYLLKSIRTSRSTATYIGSTPNPPRRVRQHNGEITQGASKTKTGRPWVMQMLVHGFPSRLSALQFEWAWQHPHISRHLREEKDEDGKGKAMFSRSRKGKYFGMNVQVARTMICTHPYSMWPLHVKFFTEDAVRFWTEADTLLKASLPLPRGFTCVAELEGVDGKSGKAGTGRRDPIEVTDDTFTSSHLAKYTRVLSSNTSMSCSICKKLIPISADPLTIAVCPTTTCTSFSHLTCLSSSFLSQPHSSSTSMIPRGGTCADCRKYVLWGDVIRGCYRRRVGKAVSLNDVEEEDLEEEEGEVFSEEDEDEMSGVAGKSKEKGKARKVKTKTVMAPVRKRSRTKAVATATNQSGEGEIFDLDAITTGDEETDKDIPEAPRAAKTKEKAGKTRKTNTAVSVQNQRRTKAVATMANQSEEGEYFDLDAITTGDEETGDDVPKAPKVAKTKEKGGKTRKITTAVSIQKWGRTKAVATTANQSEEGEYFDLDAITTGDEETGDDVSKAPKVAKTKEKAGKTRKIKTAVSIQKWGRTKAVATTANQSEEGEYFDLDAITTGEEGIGEDIPKATQIKPVPSTKTKGKGKEKNLILPTAKISPLKDNARTKSGATARKRGIHTISKPRDESEGGEFFDLDGVTSGSDGDEEPLPMMARPQTNAWLREPSRFSAKHVTRPKPLSSPPPSNHRAFSRLPLPESPDMSINFAPFPLPLPLTQAKSRAKFTVKSGEVDFFQVDASGDFAPSESLMHVGTRGLSRALSTLSISSPDPDRVGVFADIDVIEVSD
ncbi:hypothetical protein JAAARDRAFT_59073 [Jaapia argillacea MUCL 33604]|uniref:GIY-YIG domain-containing protein n=1 Tax=Jaapia argillacea MUCL 33604 TaxID=933084 RepID=A0A067PPY7_9AGAM|nr:hypothetical protein JAAARDRAFT_59073 [Jaapia argillacea MUCL 33604]